MENWDGRGGRESAAVALVRRAYDAFAARDRAALAAACHPSLCLTPVDALGLVHEEIEGFAAACEWVRQREALGYRVSIWLGTLEDLGDGRVFGSGVVSERGTTGQGYAATVAWVWRVRDGLIDSVCGYPGRFEASRALSAAA